MNKLKKYLEAIRRSQAWFADQIETTPTHLGRLMKGDSIPSLLMAWRIEQQTGGKVKVYDWIPNAEKQEMEKDSTISKEKLSKNIN